MRPPASAVDQATSAPGTRPANPFDQALLGHRLGRLHRSRVEVLQVNVGKLCNQTCAHCHVNAGPGRTEIMDRETVDRIVDWLANTDIPKIDITGGAPEIVPDFRHLVERVKALPVRRHVIDRCNLTIFFEPGYGDLPEFLARHEVEVIASLPCYTGKNVDAQRGQGVFDKSLRALRWLNDLGYGIRPQLPLHLVYNPGGAFLPGPQAGLEADYRQTLQDEFGIVFNRLLALANMPIGRFAVWLRRNGEWDRYSDLLRQNFNPGSVAGLMCRTTLSIGWRGEVYDCDFNQMLEMTWQRGSEPESRRFLWEIDPASIEGSRIRTGEHCFGCTAGAGSSCGGAIVKNPCPPIDRRACPPIDRRACPPSDRRACPPTPE